MYPPSFAELGVRDEIVRALNEIGIERTFAIQELTLPLALAGDDLIGQARTGMGKTFGFGVPLLHRIVTAENGTAVLDGTPPRALIIVPTRELCIQVARDLENASKYLRVATAVSRFCPSTAAVRTRRRSRHSRRASTLSSAPPGRLLDLANQSHLILGKVGVLVLDEADEMLDLGFLPPDIERLMGMVPDKRQTMLFSATMPGPIITLARTFLTQRRTSAPKRPNPPRCTIAPASTSTVHTRSTRPRWSPASCRPKAAARR